MEELGKEQRILDGKDAHRNEARIYHGTSKRQWNPMRGWEFDRSISRNGRGRGIKKEGGGSYNWGKQTESAIQAFEESETGFEPSAFAGGGGAEEGEEEAEATPTSSLDSENSTTAQQKSMASIPKTKAKRHANQEIDVDESVLKEPVKMIPPRKTRLH